MSRFIVSNNIETRSTGQDLYSLLPDSQRLLNQIQQFSLFVYCLVWFLIINTGLLIAVTVALLSGRLTIHGGLLNGILSDPWSNVHPSAWLVVVLLFAAHLLMIVKVGGVQLLLSMVDSKIICHKKRR